MSDLPAGRYKAKIVTRETVNYGGCDMMKLGLITSEMWEPLASTWMPIPSPTLVEATWFLRGQKGLDVSVLESFAAATGWNKDPNQFRDDSWIPNPVQVVLTTKPNKRGDGLYYNVKAMSKHDADKCEHRSGSAPSILDRAVDEWTGKIPPQPPPVVPPKPTEPQGPTASGIGGEPVPF